MINIMDKIDHAIGLATRIQNEMNSGNIDNALYLTDTFVFLFSSHQAATNDLLASYKAASRKLLDAGQLEQAEALISKGLTVDPQNSQLLSTLVEIKKAQHQVLKELGRPSVAEHEAFMSQEYSPDVKPMAHKFIQTYFPEEVPLFDLAWRIFQDITPKDFTQEAVCGALGIVGTEASQLKTPKIIVLFTQISSKDIRALPDEKFKEVIVEIGRTTGCSQELIDKLTEFILKQ